MDFIFSDRPHLIARPCLAVVAALAECRSVVVMKRRRKRRVVAWLLVEVGVGSRPGLIIVRRGEPGGESCAICEGHRRIETTTC